MKTIDQQGSTLNPNIDFNSEEGKLTISGKSIPVNVEQLFSEVITWLEEYASHPNKETKLELNLQYMNGSTIRSLIDVLKILQRMSEQGEKVKVEWNMPANAEDMKDIGEHIFSTIHIPHDIRQN